MPPIPIDPTPAGQLPAPALFSQNARFFVPSGTCSGTAATFHQEGTIMYQASSAASLVPGWLPTAGNPASGLLCNINMRVSKSFDFFSTSATATSGCANAANARQDHIFSLSSYTDDTGTGTNGNLNTSAAGLIRNWVQPGETEFTEVRNYASAWFPLDDYTFNKMIENTSVAKFVMQSIVGQIATGGFQYHPVYGSTDPQIAPAWPNFDINLVLI
tara:strand:+ start:499 stop:1146 length:648 start_codon:yes stop_codon:yes gene_type:complete